MRTTIKVLSAAALMLVMSTTVLAQDAAETPDGDAERGAEIFTGGTDSAPACAVCHSTTAGSGRGFFGGPSLAGLAERAGERVDDLDANAYIRESIITPNAYIVKGFQNIMYAQYGEHLSETDIEDLVAYLLSL